jgi:hypothetical protein
VVGRPRLSTADRLALWLSLSLALVLLLLLARVNWTLARFLGTPVILFLGLAGIVIVGALVFTYLPLAYGWPGGNRLPTLTSDRRPRLTRVQRLFSLLEAVAVIPGFDDVAAVG